MGGALNYSTLHALKGGGSSWRASSTFTDSNVTFYINSCSWIIRARVSSVALRSNWVNITAYYYNGSSWVKAYEPRGNNGYTVYKHGSGSQELKFYHNRGAEGSTSGDAHMYHIWKIVIQMRGKDGSAHGYFDYWLGGLEMMTEGEYNSYFKGKPVRYCKFGYSTSSNDTTWATNNDPRNYHYVIDSTTAGDCCATDLPY